MSVAAGGRGLTVEVDDDVLVENAATATLFSPGMWVQRPTRTPLARREGASDGRPRGASGDGVEPLLPIPLPALAPHAADAAAAGGGAAAGISPASAGDHGAAAAAGSVGGPTPGSPGLAADPDLAYLSIADERERERAEREYLQQDSEHMAALEEAYARLREQNAAMEAQLNTVVAAVNDVVDENQTIKSLLAMLKVRREDFVFNQQQTIGAQQEAIGARLLQNLEEDTSAAGGLQQQRQQQPGPAQHPQQQQQQQQPAPCPAAVALHIQTQQQQQQQGLAEPACRPGLSAGVASLGDLSPGCLLPIGTPEMLRTVSPKIAAFRGTSDGLLGSGPAGEADQQELLVPSTLPPASPLDYPAEAQIAAAALTAKQGDTAAALLTLLDKAIEGRLERQRHAAAQQAQLALLQAQVQQAPQPSQQQAQMYSM
ncbi:hypothetical protein ABPG75_006200 [Micractinium tetrahymenae]